MQSVRTDSQPRTFTPLAVAVAAALSLQPTPSIALGLGQLSAHSSLGEPLETDVELHLNSRDQHGRIEFDVTASPDAGPGDVLPQLVESLGPDGPVLKLRTTQPVNEPIVTFTLTARTGTGTVTRDYTLLLDPPQGAATRSTRTGTQANAPMLSQLRPFTDADSLRVVEGETLWEIGTRLAAGSQLAGSQVARALFDANRGAFSNDRPEDLRAGARLRIPALESANAIPASAARSWLRGGTAHEGGENLAHAGGPLRAARPAPATRDDSTAMLLATAAPQAGATSSRQSVSLNLDVIQGLRGTARIPAQRVAAITTRPEGDAAIAAPDNPMAVAMAASDASRTGDARVSLRLQRSLLEDAQATEPPSIRLARLEATVGKLQLQLAARDEQIAQLMQIAETRPGDLARVRAALEETRSSTLESDQRSLEAPASKTPFLAGLFGAGSVTVLVSAATPLLVSKLVTSWSRQALRSLIHSTRER